MDPATLGTILSGVGMGANAITDLGGIFGNYVANRELQELDQEFQSNEALLSRNWQAEQNQINRDWQTNANKLAMDFSHNEALAQREWNEYMSSSARQRDVADLRSAGLNPILAATSLGADYSSGATASGVSTSANGSGTPNSAHGSAQHVNFNLKGIGDTVHQLMSTAHEISKRADQYQHDFEMLERKQAHDILYHHKKTKSIKASNDAEDWFEQKYRNTFGD